MNEYAGTPEDVDSPLLEDIIDCVRRCDPKIDGWEMRLRKLLGPSLQTEFRPGDLLTAGSLNEIVNRLAAVERKLAGSDSAAKCKSARRQSR
jgi:hypothetical protein